MLQAGFPFRVPAVTLNRWCGSGQQAVHNAAQSVAADDPVLALMAVVLATKMALERSGLQIDDVNWIEINETISTVVLAWARETGANLREVNPWGGAIAHGHALGATGVALLAKCSLAWKPLEGR